MATVSSSTDGGGGGSVDAQSLSSTINTLVQQMTGILEEAKELATALPLDQYISTKVNNLGAMLGNYYKAFVGLNVATRDEFENLVKSHFRYSNIRDVFEELLDVEQEWAQFLETLDSKIIVDGQSVISEGDTGPVDIPVVDVRTDKTTSLQDYLTDAFDKAGVQVVVLTFGGCIGARRWLDVMDPMPFPMLSDTNRETWHPMFLTYYAEQKMAGRKLPSAFSGIEDDLNQMGGDFVLNSQGKVVLLHQSSTPTDRPSIEALLGIK